jgi:M6 family metalloprotease-like protein
MRVSSFRPVRVLLAVVTLALGLGMTAPPGAKGIQAAATTHVASGWDLVKFPLPQPVCDGVGLRFSPYFDRLDCGFVDFDVASSTPTSKVELGFFGNDGSEFFRDEATWRTDTEQWELSVTPGDTWPAGDITLKSFTDDETEPGGEFTFFHNKLGATLTATPKGDNSPYQPGEDIPVTGDLFEQDSNGTATVQTNVPGTFSLRVVDSDGTQLGGILGPFTANKGGTDGAIIETIPGAATASVTAGPDTDFRRTIAIEVVDASYDHQDQPATHEWAAARGGAASVRLRVVPDSLVLENSFVSSVGWVQPGDTYPFRLILRNPTTSAASSITVTVPAVDGTTFTNVTPGVGTATVTGQGAISWTIPSLAAGGEDASTVASLVAEAKADTTDEDPQIVWKNLSTSASLTYTGHATPLLAASHGPKVIPPGANYETARYGDRPFPVVPVDYADFQHADDHTGENLNEVINSPGYPGSTFNLYQEMSYGQLFPHGTVPSAAIAAAPWDETLYDGGYRFSTIEPQGSCHGVTFNEDPAASPFATERITGGWYQLPGTRDYYGDDGQGSAVAAGDIDDACGDTAKSVWDAAHIADPEIDYSDYDTDKDGVVDFFMMVFQGEGGNGASQTSAPPYDNIWPHSSSLEFTYTDEATKLKGYVSDDQLKDNEDRPLYYTDDSRLTMTTTVTAFPVHVRVGPYNVNPESAIDFASVISHEYGHSLGLPDFYFNDGIPEVAEHQAYGTWNLMATDYSQHMDVFGRQELGWVVPRVLAPDSTVDVNGWKDSTVDTHRIDWVQADGTPYALTGGSVHNGEAYAARLPGRKVVTQEHMDTAAPGNVQAWWSGSGNDFGCPPMGGHNLDIYLPALADVPDGTPVTLTLKSGWDIEWDYDFGYVMTSVDGGKTYQSHDSDKGYTNTANPSGNSCQDQYSNGITGSSGSYKDGTEEVDRTAAVDAYPSMEFIDDTFTLDDVAGQDTVLRFSYTTDPGLSRPGWFIDNVTVKAGDTVLYENNFDVTPDDQAVYNGGCGDNGLKVAVRCTAGWQPVSAAVPSAADHAYYMELRDRTGFDFDSHGQADRGDLTWLPGLSLAYTDEARGYGNAGYPNPPRQNVLDANPEAESDNPNLDDAAFRFSDVKSFTDFGDGHVDNYTDDSREDGFWRFDYNCLSFEILSMTGDDVGPSATPGNLTGDVRFTTGTGCGTFDYGYGAQAANAAPVAAAQAKPTTITAGESVSLDASGSTDDNQAGEDLEYRWDVDGDGTYDVTGREVVHRYDVPGTYDATVEVKDADGLTDTASVTVTVNPAAGDGGGGSTGDCQAEECAGYYLAASDGGVFAFGDAPFYGSLGWRTLNAPIVDMASLPDDSGYWLVSSDGGVFAFGDAEYHGSALRYDLSEPIVGMTPTSTGDGYWLVAADGGVFAFGDAEFQGSMGGMPLNSPISGLAAMPDDSGYWLVAEDGGVFAFGDARFHGSAVRDDLNGTITDIAAGSSGEGYWLSGNDGGVFAYGDAPFHGSMGGKELRGAMAVVGATPTDGGYWLAALDGGVFAFGDAPFHGSMGGVPLNAPIVAFA